MEIFCCLVNYDFLFKNHHLLIFRYLSLSGLWSLGYHELRPSAAQRSTLNHTTVCACVLSASFAVDFSSSRLTGPYRPGFSRPVKSRSYQHSGGTVCHRVRASRFRCHYRCRSSVYVAEPHRVTSLSLTVLSIDHWLTLYTPLLRLPESIQLFHTRLSFQSKSADDILPVDH